MRRRTFIAGLASAAARPVVARAQQVERVRRVGVLMNFAATQTDGQSFVTAFIQRLRELKWVEGQNLQIDLRWNAGDAFLARLYAAQLIGLAPDVILAASTTNLTAVRQATSTVPIVFISITDPVAQGIVGNANHPGGNLTGFSSNEFSLGGKWLDLLKQVAPDLNRVAVMFNPDTSPQAKFYMEAIEAAAPARGVTAIASPVRTVADLKPAIEGIGRQPNGGLLLTTDSFTRLHNSQIAELAARYRLPSISYVAEFATKGGLMSYGTTDFVRQYQQAADYVDRILKGARPGDLPVQGVDRYSLTINLKTAKSLGLEIPANLLAVVDEVIE